jgi:hypothetical protein
MAGIEARNYGGVAEKSSRKGQKVLFPDVTLGGFLNGDKAG